MLKSLFATSAVAALLAVSAQAQDTSPADEQTTPPRIAPEVTEDSPMVEGIEQEAQGAEDPAAQPAEDSVADDPAAPAPADSMAEDPATQPAEGTVADDPAAPAPADTMAEEPAATSPADTMAADPAAPADAVPLEEGWSEVDVATISTDSLIGADIRTYEDETVASVQDVLLSPEGQVENVVARFGGFLGFGETTVLLSLDEIAVVKDADENMRVLTDLTPEALKDRPEYEETEG